MVAVITGDLINSREVKSKQKLNKALKEALDWAVALSQQTANYDVFRGDSFQLLCPDPNIALQVALGIRTYLRSTEHNTDNPPWDARISIGLGEVAHKARKVSASTGTAFERSGIWLDKIKEEGRNLHIQSDQLQYDEEWLVELSLADVIIGSWSSKAAEVAFHYLCNQKTQMEMASLLGVSQSAINQRVKHGRLEVILLLLKRYHAIIAQIDS